MVDKFNIDRTIARFAGILALGTILGACANDQKRVVQEFADGLNVGMHISRVQEIAKANKSIYLMEGHIGIESVRYYCREQYCVPKNLLELLHPRVEEGRNSQDFSVAEPSLDFKHYGVGRIKQTITIFYDGKSGKVIGWTCGGTDPVSCTPK